MFGCCCASSFRGSCRPGLTRVSVDMRNGVQRFKATAGCLFVLLAFAQTAGQAHGMLLTTSLFNHTQVLNPNPSTHMGLCTKTLRTRKLSLLLRSNLHICPCPSSLLLSNLRLARVRVTTATPRARTNLARHSRDIHRASRAAFRLIRNRSQLSVSAQSARFATTATPTLVVMPVVRRSK